jgi:hypothetical protein
MKSIIKILRENIYVTLIVSFIILSFFIFLIIKVVYPIWVIDTLLEMKPNFTEVEKQLKVSSFGDMYGALNTFFAGLALVGASMAVFLQIYLFRHDKAIAKQEKEDEERQILYYIWFRLDSIVRETEEALEMVDFLIEKIRTDQQFFENSGKVGYRYDDEKKMYKTILQLNDIDVERNHLIYLKYLNDEALIRLFEHIPKYFEDLKKHIVNFNDYIQKSPKKEYYDKLRNLIQIYWNSISYISDDDTALDKDVKLMKLCIDPHIKAIIDSTISLEELQKIGTKVVKFLDSYPYFDANVTELRRMKYKINYTECDIFEDTYKEWYKKQDAIKEDITGVRGTLNNLKSQSKIPKSI